MKVNIDMENMADLVKEAVENNINTTIKNEVNGIAENYVRENFKNKIEKIFNENMTDYVNDYIKNATITVGGGFYSDEDIVTYTVENYIKKELSNILSSKKLNIYRKNSYGNEKKEEVTFEEFIKSAFEPNKIVEKRLTEFMNETKNEINKKIDETFTGVTKNMLSETVFNILMNNETFNKMNKSIKCIADKTE